MDLSTIRVVDNHCHSLFRAPVRSRDAFRLLFAEASDKAFASHIAGMAYYEAGLVELSRELGVSDDEEVILAARASQDQEAWIARLLGAARIDTLLVDDGYPPAEVDCYSREELARLGQFSVGHITRLEVTAQNLIAAHHDFGDFRVVWRTGLRDLRSRGIVSLKSVAAYRTGLDVAPPDEARAREGFEEARRIVQREGRVRLANKWLLEYLLHDAIGAASEQGVPIQFHTGYGDPQTDLRLGNPLHLRGVLEEPRYGGAPVVLLHESYPFTREAAFLAAVYPNVYMDFSYGVPNVGKAELRVLTDAALAVAPMSKIMYSSDGHSIPEHNWLSAERGRAIITAALEEMVTRRELRAAAAEAAGSAILRDNAYRVYRLDSEVVARASSSQT